MSSKPLTDRMRALELDHARQNRALSLVATEGERTAGQTDALIRDQRDTRRIVQDIEARLLVVAGTQGEMLSVMSDMARELSGIRAAVTVGGATDAELRRDVDSARRKASGAHHRAVSVEARQSKTEEQIARALAEAAAAYEAAKAETDRRIAKVLEAPPDVAERRALMADMYRSARPWAPKIVGATALLILGVLALGLAAVHSCSPGGF
jgi:capsule polysaccharide export protein KpsE/RkpR